MKRVITYGTFDLFHIGHLKMLSRLKEMGDYLIVGVSTDEFNELKGKKSVYSYEERSSIVSAIRVVDEVIPEISWDQKLTDIKEKKISIFGIGKDWKGRFDELDQYCEVVYLDRTPSISSTEIKKSISMIDQKKITEIKHALDGLNAIINAMD